MMLAAIGVAIDILSIILPGAASRLWQQGQHPAAIGAWFIWAIALTMTLMAGSGFASTQIGDAVAGRVRSSDEAAATADLLERLRADRKAITEARSVPTIEAEISRLEGGAVAIWTRSKGCTDVTRTDTAAACDPIHAARMAREEALRRDQLDAQIDGLAGKLEALPATGGGDPGAAMAAETVSALGIAVTVHQVERIRVIGLAIVPSMAGMLLNFAMLLGRRP
jgi:hypothetical protein